MVAPRQQQLTVEECAERVGLRPSTFRAYVTRGLAPKPDGHVGRTPWWAPSTIATWNRSRPGQGQGGGRPAKKEAS